MKTSHYQFTPDASFNRKDASASFGGTFDFLTATKTGYDIARSVNAFQSCSLIHGHRPIVTDYDIDHDIYHYNYHDFTLILILPLTIKLTMTLMHSS